MAVNIAQQPAERGERIRHEKRSRIEIRVPWTSTRDARPTAGCRLAQGTGTGHESSDTAQCRRCERNELTHHQTRPSMSTPRSFASFCSASHTPKSVARARLRRFQTIMQQIDVKDESIVAVYRSPEPEEH